MLLAVTTGKGDDTLPLAKIHVLEGQYDEARLDKVSARFRTR